MSIDIRFPNITAPTEAGKLQQLQSYMHQLVEQLNWALNTIDTSGGAGYVVREAQKAGASSQTDDPISSFNSIKGLIIKSADIVEAYYDEITKLIDKNNHYAAYSDFGDFVEDTNNVLYADGTGLTQKIDNIQKIFDKDGNIIAERLVNGRIFSGILEYAMDGEAIVGIEIGQTTVADGVSKFNKFARFTADKLAFYNAVNPDEPVAYISDYKLYITHVEIIGSLTEGGYVDTITDGGGIVTKWVGGA